jgi:hypothetical protein
MFLAIILGASVVGSHAQAASANQVVGTWRMVSAQIDPEGRNLPAYGQRPNGMLVFTPDMHFIEVLTDADTPRFASNVRGGGHGCRKSNRDVSKHRFFRDLHCG